MWIPGRFTTRTRPGCVPLCRPAAPKTPSSAGAQAPLPPTPNDVRIGHTPIASRQSFVATAGRDDVIPRPLSLIDISPPSVAFGRGLWLRPTITKMTEARGTASDWLRFQTVSRQPPARKGHAHQLRAISAG